MAQPVSDAVLGLDLGGSKLALRLERSDGTQSDCRIDLTGTIAADLDALRATIAALTKDCRLLAVGLAHAPTLDHAGRVVRWPNRPQWEGLALLDILAGWVKAPVVAADDGCAAALADARTLGEADHLHLSLGTGVGGGLVLGGALYLPPGGVGTEIGHMLVWPGGKRCTCGRQGCLQAYASARAVQAAAAASENTPLPTLAAVTAAAERGEPTACKALDEAAFALAAALTTLTEVLGPLPVTLGGGMMAAVPRLAEAVTAHAKAIARPGTPPARAQPSPHGADAAVVGALLLAREAAQETFRP